MRIVFPFDANSTDAFAIALPFGSETTPEIFTSGCCADAAPTKTTIQHVTNA